MLDDLVRKVWAEGFVVLAESGAFDPENPSVTRPTPDVQDVRGFARLVASAVQLLHAEDAQDFRSGILPISTFRTCDGFAVPGSSIEENWQVLQFAGSNGFDGWIPTDSDDTDHEFVCELLQVLAMIPSASWDQLTPARRICMAADLGELIRISIDIDEGALNRLAATVLVHVCAGDGALIDAAQIAGEALEYRWGEGFFAIDLNSIRSLSGRLRRA